MRESYSDSLAINVMSALAQPTRFSVFRLLMRVGAEGMRAGAIAEELGVPQNTLSSHLNILTRAGIVNVERRSRQMIYTIDLNATKGFTDYLVHDCCYGHPEFCNVTPETNPLKQSAE